MNNKRFDRQKALQWLEGDERMFARITSIFIKNIPSQVESLNSFIEAHDADAVERAAHTIMGSAAMLGAPGMSEAAGRIERSAMAGDLNAARLHFAELVGEYEAVMAELAAEGGA